MSRTQDQAAWRRRKAQGLVVVRVEVPAGREADIERVAAKLRAESASRSSHASHKDGAATRPI